MDEKLMVVVAVYLTMQENKGGGSTVPQIACGIVEMTV